MSIFVNIIPASQLHPQAHNHQNTQKPLPNSTTSEEGQSNLPFFRPHHPRATRRLHTLFASACIIIITNTINKKCELMNEDTKIPDCDDKRVEMCLEISRLEYEYSFRRAEKFDNKVYILLTVCGFILVMFTNAVSNIGEIDIFSPFKSKWIMLYDILFVLNVAGIMTILVRLVISLAGLNLRRHNSNLILERNMILKSPTDIALFTITQYEMAKGYNNVQLSRRYRFLETSVRLLIVLVIMLISITIVSSFAVKL